MTNFKRPYATKTKRRTYTVTDDVHAELQRLGKGNASAGIRVAARYHGRLVEALESTLNAKRMEDYHEARALLKEIEEAK